MNAKVKNNSSRYITRASFAGAISGKVPSPALSPSDRAEQERRNAVGEIDKRWYMQLPPKR